MSLHGPAAVLATDRRWFDHFRPVDRLTRVDEVNFWRPMSQTQFQMVPVGGPVFFRLKAPDRAIAGYGFFASQAMMTLSLAWEIFADRNGDPTFDSFAGRLGGYRQRFGGSGNDPERQLSCIVVRDAVFLPESHWLPWDAREGWSDSIVAGKGYQLDAGIGAVLADLLVQTGAITPLDLGEDYTPFSEDLRVLREVSLAEREAQGTFRIRLLEAYGRQCAVTHEHSLPVLDAAHIQPYRGAGSNHIQNGLVLRTDLHRLYDEGYVTVTPDYHLRVSRRLDEEFHNGKTYYALDGREIILPQDERYRPSRLALEWHADEVFR